MDRQVRTEGTIARVIKVDAVEDAAGGDLRVWWIRNLPGIPEYHLVESRKDAVQSLKLLQEQDLKDDNVDSNAGGMEVFEDGGWTEWYDEDENDIDYWLDLAA